MNPSIESYLLLSLVDRETIGQEVNNPEVTVLDHPSVNGRDLHQHKRLMQTSASSSLGRCLAVVCFQSFFLLWGAYCSILVSNLIYMQILYTVCFGKCLLLREQKTDLNRNSSSEVQSSNGST